MKQPVICTNCGRVTYVSHTDVAARCEHCGFLVSRASAADVFVSYTGADARRAEAIALGLRSKGLSVWFAPDTLYEGAEFLPEICSAIDGCKVVMTLLSDAAMRSPWVYGELHRALGARRPIVPVIVAPCPRIRDWGILWATVHAPHAFRQLDEAAIEELTKVIAYSCHDPLAVLPTPGYESADLNLEPIGCEKGMPYVGPTPFSSLERDKFTGRDAEGLAVRQLLDKHRCVAVDAPSGAGKSSLLGAYVAAHERGLVLKGRVGGADSKASDGLGAAACNPFTRNLLNSLGIPPVSSGRLCDALRGMRGSTLLILDQFEELVAHKHLFSERAPFMEDLAQALQELPDLRVVFAYRQEFRAELTALLQSLPPALWPANFQLQRMDDRAVVAAIRAPALRFARFADGVAETLARQLKVVYVPGPAGESIPRPAECVELVHLQIVCRHLWESLPPGTTTITLAHLALDGPADEFAKRALDTFYSKTVAAVAERLHQESLNIDLQFIKLGCMSLIDGTNRRLVPQGAISTGRLPNRAAALLEEARLLRCEQHGDVRWYELSHDLLAEKVSSHVTRELEGLLFAARLLTAVLEQRIKESKTLDGIFPSHPELLQECARFHNQPGLFEHEIEFLFRASLGSGLDVATWGAMLGVVSRGILLRVLNEAIRSTITDVRARAAELLGVRTSSGFLISVDLAGEAPWTRLVASLATSDVAPDVRTAASLAVARRDERALYDIMTQTGTLQARIDAMAIVRNYRDLGHGAAGWSASQAGLDSGTRLRTVWRSKMLRARSDAAFFICTAFIAAVASGLGAGLVKWIPGWYGCAMSHATPSIGAGLIQGFMAGAVWGFLITVAIQAGHSVFGRCPDRPSYLRPWWSLILGTLGGFLSGVMVSFLAIGLYENHSLKGAGWAHDPPRISWTLLGKPVGDVLLGTRMGLVYVITGTFLGLGMALITNAVLSSSRFRALASSPGAVDSLRSFGRTARQCLQMVIPRAWLLVLALFLAGLIAFEVIQPGDQAFHANPRVERDADGHVTKEKVYEVGDKNTTLGQVAGVSVDCLCQVVGGCFSVAAIAFANVFVRRGVRLRPRGEDA